MLNIVIPMAGRGSRFARAGYEMPKPLINVHGHYMIEYVIQNIRPQGTYRFIFLCLDEHLRKYDLENKLKEIEPSSIVIPVGNVTEGAACTVLLAEKYIDDENPLMIANSDQYVDIDINGYLAAMQDYDGFIMTMSANDPKWSFIAYDQSGFVTMIREKEVISNEATVGVYNYKHGSDYVRYAHQMILKNIRVNNEFYVAPVYNEMIEEGKRIGYFNVGSESHGMYGLGIPEDLEKFLENPVSEIWK